MTHLDAAEIGLSPETSYYWRGSDGQVLMETDSSLQIYNLYFYLNGERVAYGADLGDDGLYFYYNDHLGNVRMITNEVGTSCYDADYFPWGGQITTFQNSCPTQYFQFTGKPHDPVMGVDYFGARYYKNDMARFYSADGTDSAQPLAYSALDNPQSLNRYTYVLNNPLTLRDEDGHFYGTWQMYVDAGTVAAQQQIHVETTITVHANTHWWNRLGSWLSSGFTSLSAVFSRSLGSFGGDRSGMRFRPADKQTVLNRNAAENGGTNVCENCGQPTIPAQQSQAGVPRPGNESTVDHIYPRSLGGNGTPDNGENLCATCNGIKSDSLPVMEEPEVMPEIPIEIPFIP